jgi:hypothetical protein
MARSLPYSAKQEAEVISRKLPQSLNHITMFSGLNEATMQIQAKQIGR